MRRWYAASRPGSENRSGKQLHVSLRIRVLENSTLTLWMLHIIQGLLGLPDPTDDGKFCRSVWLQRRGIHWCWRQNCVRDSNDSLWSFLIEMVVECCHWFRPWYDPTVSVSLVTGERREMMQHQCDLEKLLVAPLNILVALWSRVLMKCLWFFCRATFDQIAEININIDAGHDSVSSRPRATGTGLEQRFFNYGSGPNMGHDPVGGWSSTYFMIFSILFLKIVHSTSRLQYTQCFPDLTTAPSLCLCVSLTLPSGANRPTQLCLRPAPKRRSSRLMMTKRTSGRRRRLTMQHKPSLATGREYTQATHIYACTNSWVEHIRIVYT